MHKRKKKTTTTLRVGLGLMAAAYSGDLNYNGEKFYRFYPGFNAFLQFGKNKLITPQLNMGYGKFVAQNRTLESVSGYTINKYVETSFFYADLRLKVKFLRKKRFNPYGSIGPELLSFTPRDAAGNALADNFESRMENEAYGSVAFALPLSLGFDLNLSPVFGLSLEYTYRITSSDYLDNIGELGLKSGKDKLNTFLLSLYVNFNPENPITRKDLRTREPGQK